MKCIDSEKKLARKINKTKNHVREFAISNLKKPFFKSVSIVAGGAVISQIINLVFSPMITRLYDPGIFGALGVFLSIVSVITPLAKLSYPYAIVLPKEDEDSIYLLRFSVFSGVVFSLLITIIVFSFQQTIAHALKLDEYAHYLYIVPLFIFFSVLISAYDQWLVRKRKFTTSSIISVTQSFIKDATLVGMGLFYPPLASLVGINTFAQAYHAFASMFSARKAMNRNIHKNPQFYNVLSKKSKKLIYEYRDFPFYRTPQILLNQFSTNLPIMLLSAFAGPVAAGLYTLCRRVVKLPSLLIGDAFAKVFEQRVAQKGQSKEPIQPFLIKSTALLLGIGTIPFGLLIIFGPFLFSLVFGSEWIGAGVYARWLSIWLVFAFANKPVVKAIPLLDLQKEYLLFEIISVILKTGSLIFGFLLLESDISAIIIFSIVGALLNITLIFYTITISKEKNRFMVKNL